MRVIIRTIASTNAHRIRIAEAEFEHGSWISAAERALNEAKGYTGPEQRFLIVDQYLGGGFAPPFGMHTVQFARYDDQAKAYRVDDRLRLEVIRE